MNADIKGPAPVGRFNLILRKTLHKLYKSLEERGIYIRIVQGLVIVCFLV